MNVNIPHFNAIIQGICIENKTYPAIIHSLRARAGKILTFHAHLECGAHYSLIPLNHITHKEVAPLSPSILQPWDCLSDNPEIITYEYFQFRKVIHKDLGEGEYLFTIDFLNNQYSDDTKEFKQYHFIKLLSGHFGAFPNNYLLFKEKTFTHTPSWDNLPKFIRQPQEIYKSVEE